MPISAERNREGISWCSTRLGGSLSLRRRVAIRLTIERLGMASLIADFVKGCYAGSKERAKANIVAL